VELRAVEPELRSGQQAPATVCLGQEGDEALGEPEDYARGVPAEPDVLGPELRGVRGAGQTAATLDTRRVRSLTGLLIGMVGPRAYVAVSGTLLALLVASRTASALGVVLALTANRLAGWIAYPLLGRASDLTTGRLGRRLGRRAPYMAGSLVFMGACTYAYTMVGGYWPLVGLIAVAKLSANVFNITTAAVVPETFGKSRTLSAAAAIGAAGAVVTVVLKGTVIATWNQADPSTWMIAFRMAGVFMMVVGAIVALLVRESPAAIVLSERERLARRSHWREELADLMKVPNAKVLLAAVMVFWAGASATGWLAVVYFEKVLHAGAAAQTVAGWLTGIPALLLGVPAGYWISRRLTRMQVAVLAPLAGTILSVGQVFATHLWQAVAFALIGAPWFAAFVISLGPMLVQLLPRSGGMAELLGKIAAPFSISAVVFALLAGWSVDLAGSYRVIWVFPALAGAIQAFLMRWLWIPPGEERPTRRYRVQDIMRLAGRYGSRGRAGLLSGEVSAKDADATTLFESLRRFVGDPYTTSAGSDRRSADSHGECVDS
jgi:hypothetical protein